MHVSRSSVPTYFVPESIRLKVEQARIAMEALDGEERQSPMKIVGVQPGQELELPIRGLFARVFGVSHGSCPAVGYLIGSRQIPVLKPEYRGLDKQEIRKLVAEGVAIKTEPTEVLHAAYTGDTSVDGLLARNLSNEEDESERNSILYLQQAFQCRLFFCEATFLDDSDKARDLSTKRGHLHIQDIARVLEERQFATSERQLVLLHISGRYNANAALDQIADALPDNVDCLVAISSHLDPFRRGKFWTRLVKGNGCVRLSDYIRSREKSQARDEN